MFGKKVWFPSQGKKNGKATKKKDEREDGTTGEKNPSDTGKC